MLHPRVPPALPALVVGPALAAASSGLSLFGLGAAFWALVFGTVASLLVEGEALRRAKSAETRQTA